MRKHWLWALVPGLLIGATGCPDVTADQDEIGTGGPIVEFDPGNRVIPFPNNLLINRMTGLVELPASCNESPASKATREGVLNKLDGFGTYEVAMSVTFTEPVDEASLAGKVVLYKRIGGMTVIDPAAAMPVTVQTIKGQTARYSLDCSAMSVVDSVTIVPLVSLDPRSTYTVGLLSGIKTATGADYGASFTWSLVRQADPPVTLDGMGNVKKNNTPLDPGSTEDANGNGIGDDLESLRGIDQLWRAHNPALNFLEAKGHMRGDVILAWEFTTQTTTGPLTPIQAMSPANAVTTGPMGMGTPGPLVGLTSLPGFNRAMAPWVLCDPAGGGPGGDSDLQCYLKISLGAAACEQPDCPTTEIYTRGDTACGLVGCTNVADVLGGAVVAKQFQVDTPNTFDMTKPIPGPWGHPLRAPVVKTETIGILAIVPAGTAPAGGFPTIVFGHGLGSTKKSVFAIGPQLATPNGTLVHPGFITVAIDFVAHDSRAVRISNAAALGCADAAGRPTPTKDPQCYAPFLSPNLAGTRDNIRQSVIDLHSLVEALKACGAANCVTPQANFKIDTTKIGYAGISLGGILGSMAVATKPELKQGLLNVAGAGWVDILENTQTLAIRCSLVNGLIDAGILMGAKSDATFTTGLCTTDAWKTQPAYRQFSAIGRWVLDSADPANFRGGLAMKKAFIQEVVGDTVVPNVATDRLGALIGLGMGMTGDPNGATTTTPSAALLTNSMTSKFLKYPTITTPEANTFVHSSLLKPAPGTDGSLATARLQRDGIFWLIVNK